MDVPRLQRQFIDFRASLFREGILDDQFIQLEKLSDDSNPGFVFEVISLFFDDSEMLLNNLAQALQQRPIVDFKKVANHAHQIKGSSASIGAQRVKNVCVAFRSYCNEENLDGCLRCLQQINHEYALVKNKLEMLLRLEQQILAAGGAIPPVD
ncbi:hypothetical protein Dimus_016004 [Dionaea muscipula]